jgi:Domain of unknown function (DUF3846)
MIAKIIEPNGHVYAVKPANGTDFSLEELQGFVGGYIQVIEPPSRCGAVLVVNEEGKFQGLPVNRLATAMWQEGADPHSERMTDHVVGRALLCHTSQIQ